MIQFNLLPTVKLDYIKAHRSKQTTLVVAIAVGLSALAICILLFLVVNVVQKKHLSDLNKDIQTYSTQLQNTQDLEKVLTVQNQLNSLTSLHDAKPVASRLAGYLSQVTPAQASISSLKLDFSAHTIIMDGTADQLSSVNKYVDTLKFTTFTTKDETKKGNAFSNVVLSGFSRGEKTTYSLSLSFDPAIFDGNQEVTLTVPRIITTRSETEKPSALFQSQPAPQGGQ